MPSALITGITGQDGSYLAELLLEKGYEVYGIVRRSSTFSTARIEHLYRDPHEEGVSLRLVYGDLSDGTNISAALNEIQPDEVYNLGAQSHVRVSFDQPIYTVDFNYTGDLGESYVLRFDDGGTDRWHTAMDNLSFSQVPEPSTLVLLILAGLTVLGLRRR